MALGGDPTGLVVGDHEPAVLVELESVDDAPEPKSVEVDLDLELDADRVHRGGVLQAEVAPHELLGVVEEGGLGLGVEVEAGELGVDADGLDGLVEAGEGGGQVAGVRGRQNSRSSVACTSVPLVAGADGGSGRRSMAEKRKARAQSVNDETFDGDSELGSGRAMPQP